MSDIVNINLIKTNIQKKSKEDVIKELASLINNEKRLNNYEEYLSDVLSREKLATTGIGLGIAIPHGKSKAVKIPTIAVGRIYDGVEWNSLDGKPVNIVFLLAVPEETASNKHLKILAALSRKLMSSEFVDKLFNNIDKIELLKLLSSVFQEI